MMKVKNESKKINSRKKKLPQPKSKFNCVYWSRFDRKWRAKVVHDKKQYDLGGYATEIEAARASNWKCVQLGLDVANKAVGVQPPIQRQFQKKQSKYKCVHWQKANSRWRAQVRMKGKILSAGCHATQLEAAQILNGLCDELGVPRKNPEVGVKKQRFAKDDKQKSKYNGVRYCMEKNKWQGHFYLHATRTRYVTNLYHRQIDAAKALNGLYNRLRVPHKNPSVTAVMIERKLKYDKPVNIPNSRNEGKNGEV